MLRTFFKNAFISSGFFQKYVLNKGTYYGYNNNSDNNGTNDCPKFHNYSPLAWNAM